MSHDKEPMLTKIQAYDAMFHFLEEEYRLCPSSDIGGLLGSLSRHIWTNRMPADPGAWEQWEEAVSLTLRENAPSFKNDSNKNS